MAGSYAAGDGSLSASALRRRAWSRAHAMAGRSPRNQGVPGAPGLTRSSDDHRASITRHLTERDREILRAVERHRVRTTDHIAAAFFPSPKRAWSRCSRRRPADDPGTERTASCPTTTTALLHPPRPEIRSTDKRERKSRCLITNRPIVTPRTYVPTPLRASRATEQRSSAQTTTPNPRTHSPSAPVRLVGGASPDRGGTQARSPVTVPRTPSPPSPPQPRSSAYGRPAAPAPSGGAVERRSHSAPRRYRPRNYVPVVRDDARHTAVRAPCAATPFRAQP